MTDMMGNLFDYLKDNEEPATESLVNEENKEAELTPADESAIFLAALKDSCSPEEYNKIVNEGACELELYTLIPSASVATESRKYVVKMEKQNDMNREEKKACIRIAKAKGDALYTDYKKARTKMIERRQQIFQKYASQARQVARQVLVNSRRKASSMTSDSGKSIVDKMDKRIAEANKKADK